MRFLWLRTFHPGIAVRVEHGPSQALLVATELSGKGGYEPGHVKRHVERALLPDEWSQLQQLLAESEFWKLPTNDDELGLDGAQWVLEVSHHDRYHVVDRWGGGAVEAIGRYLITLSDLDPRPIY
jgi:hypothetical protein